MEAILSLSLGNMLYFSKIESGRENFCALHPILFANFRFFCFLCTSSYYSIINKTIKRVDFLYRDIEFVTRTIEKSNKGIIRSDYWQQPAYGFHSYIYCAEISFCQPLYDLQDTIAQLKTEVEHYPQQLKRAILKDFLWRARFFFARAASPLNA